MTAVAVRADIRPGGSDSGAAGRRSRAVVPGSRAAAPEHLQWLTPAPLWNESPIGSAASAVIQPWIAELTSDSFVPEFLGILAGENGSSPADLTNTTPATTVDRVVGGPYRLFQPLSQRYYMVAASLVCRRPGIPDHAVRPAKGERTTFVMRRLESDGTESAWVPTVGASASGKLTPGAPPSGTWLPATATEPVPGEEQLPMHPAPVGGFAVPGSTAATLGMTKGEASSRTVFYGYIPVGRRERMIPAMSDADALAKLKAHNESTALPKLDPIADELYARVIGPWLALRDPPNPPPDPHYPSLYLILDLADWLKKYLPDLYAAICNNTGMPNGSKRKLLQDSLGSILVPKSGGGTVTLTGAIADLQGFAPLVTGADEIGPTVTYDLRAAAVPGNWLSVTANDSLCRLAITSIPEEAESRPLSVPPELSGLIKDDPVYVPKGTKQTMYIIRTVFTHEPCQPVLSAATHPFALARATDGDAPARKIRIQLPDVSNMRSFQRGVALEMPPSLQRLLNRVTPKMLKGEGLDPDGGLGLGMICSFSLQIIFICAFVVLFIFLLLLNIVFWWLPFLKICFPIPVRHSEPKAPSP